MRPVAQTLFATIVALLAAPSTTVAEAPQRYGLILLPPIAPVIEARDLHLDNLLATSEQCAPVLDVTPQDGSLTVTVHAPCQGGQAVTVDYDGLAVTTQTTADGMLEARLPRLPGDGRVAVVFADGSILSDHLSGGPLFEAAARF